MTTCLSLNGINNYLISPSLPFDTVEMTITPINISSGKYYLDARPALSGGYFNSFDGLGAGWTSEYVNGVLDSSRPKTFTLNQKVTIKVVASTSNTGVVYFFCLNGNTTYADMQGYVYDLKIYNAGSLKAHYDLTTGTTQDQTGNGYHITNYSGTFIDDGLGGTGTNATITGVVATATASSLAPTVSTQIQVSISSVVANATASTLVPSISTDTSVTSGIANTTASVIAPAVQTVQNVSVIAPVSSATASAFIPSAGPLSVLITSVVASLTAIAIVPSVSIINTIIRTINLGESLSPSINLRGSLSSSINLNLSNSPSINLRGGI